MLFKNVVLSFTTLADGTVTFNYDGAIYGLLYEIEYVKGTLDNGVDVTVSMQNTASGVARTLLNLTDANANAVYKMRVDEHGSTGTASGNKTYELLDGTPRVVIAQGGNVKSGKIILHYFN